jgi:outer membrane scaffolding protein for murein synthesis (MipA/OmpV family)
MKIFFTACIYLLAAHPAAFAQETGLPLWEAGLVAGGVSTPAYPASSDRSSRALALPFLIYRGEVLRSDRSGIGARLAHTDDYEFDVGFSASLPASSNDVAARQNMPDLGTLLEFGPRMKVTLARPSAGSRVRLIVPVRSVLEFNSGVRGQGVAFEPELAYETRDLSDGWSLSANASLVWGDSQLNQYLYGVSPAYATAARPAYEAQSGLIASRLGLGASTQLGKDVRILGFVRYENYAGSANRNSPLFLQSSGTSYGLWLTWTLGRSEARARD